MGIEERSIKGNILERLEYLVPYRSSQTAQILVVIPVLAEAKELVVELLEAVGERGSTAFQGCRTELDVSDARYFPIIRDMR